MKMFVVALLVAAVAADVSHLQGPQKEYLPPFQGGQGQGQFGQPQVPSREYLSPLNQGGAGHGGAGQFQGGNGGFGGQFQGGAGGASGHAPSNQYLAPHQGQQFGGQQGGHGQQFGGQQGGHGQQPSNQYLAPFAGNNPASGHSLGNDGYKYKTPNF